MPRTPDFENIEREMDITTMMDFEISATFVDQVSSTRKKISGHTISYKRAWGHFIPPISKSRASTARTRVGITTARNSG